jgi:hypothetical protein
MSKIKLNPNLQGICPCGRKFFVDEKQYAVIHELPVCEKFQTLNPTEFLRYVTNDYRNHRQLTTSH